MRILYAVGFVDLIGRMDLSISSILHRKLRPATPSEKDTELIRLVNSLPISGSSIYLSLLVIDIYTPLRRYRTEKSHICSDGVAVGDKETPLLLHHSGGHGETYDHGRTRVAMGTIRGYYEGFAGELREIHHTPDGLGWV